MMLGAQARAAEYNAAKNASARQANREADEQKLPPKPAPISLSAYTRNPQINRNKGTKNWVPLVLPEATDDEDTQDVESVESTVSSQEHSARSDQNTCTPCGPKATQHNQIRVNMPQAVAPIAPRAMRVEAYPAKSNHQLAAMSLHQSVVNDGPSFIPTALYSGNPSAQTFGFAIDGTPEGMQGFGGMTIPTDITPTKQEQKLSMLSQAYRNPLYAVPDNHVSNYDHAGHGNAVHIQPHYADVSILVPNPAADHTFQAIHPTIPGSFRHPEPHQVYSDLAPEPKTAIYDPQQSLNRHNSLPAASANPITPPQSVASNPPMSLTQPLLRDKENEAPYDRASKMQKFIAAQQAVAKTGKTVLNNPDLRKSQETKPEPLKENVDDPMSLNREDITKSIIEEVKDSATQTVPKIPPGLEEMKPKLKFDYSFPPAPLVSQDDAMHELFGVGTDEWLDLKPVSRKDRLKMLDMMSFVVLDLEGENAFSAGPSTNPKRKEAIGSWMHSDPRPYQAARKEVDEIAKKYSSRVSEPDTNCGEDFANVSGVDIVAGVVRGAGNIMATLTEYIAENGKKTEETAQDYFNRTKAAPEFAVERSGNGSNYSSLFESEGGVFYNPPNRIARDPRFRSQAKEGVKTRSEDDWLLHYDLYPRRKV